MRFEKTDVWGFEHSLRGMRNPYDSWNKSDTVMELIGKHESHKWEIQAKIGENDMTLAKSLIKGGSEHRKFLRQIFVSVDITAPLYWWKEFDTYKIGTTANSCSTMHTLTKYPITIDMFEMDDFNDVLMGSDVIDYRIKGFWQAIVEQLEALRQKYVETKNKTYWKELVRLLPESFLQKRTVTMNYENLLSICKQRKAHRLTEWNSFIRWANALPYAKEFIFNE